MIFDFVKFTISFIATIIIDISAVIIIAISDIVKKWWRAKLIRRFVILIAIIALVVIVTSDKIGAIMEALTPPELHPVPTNYEQVTLEQNWTDEGRKQFHHISQGTSSIPIPLEWFLALEAPNANPWGLLFFENGKYAADDYLLRHGFIRGEVTELNPHGLPIGFATTEFQNVVGIEGSVTTVGLTCAGCHTGHIVYDKREYIIEGGSPAVDLPLLIKTLGAALGQTLISSKIPFFNGRFDRFARDVLKDQYSDAGKVKLAQELETVVTAQAAKPSGIDVVEGFSRLDALNRIGNQVFAFGPNRPENFTPINAPVTFPHLWTSPWFDWVQYDGSVMQPLIRNSGEAIGVQAHMDYSAPPGEKRFSSAIPIRNLEWIEEMLSGEEPPTKKKGFGGLQSPRWLEIFPAPDTSLVRHGRDLYEIRCQSCHLRPIKPEDLPSIKSEAMWVQKSEEIWDHLNAAEDDSTIWDYFKPIKYYKGNTPGSAKEIKTKESLLHLKIITLEQVGTDPAQSKVMAERTVNTAGISGSDDVEGMGLNAEICVQGPMPDYIYGDEKEKTPYFHVRLTDGPMVSYAYALGAIVQQVNDQWFDSNFIPKKQRRDFEGERPNCLQAGLGYKARPLNGIWATAPFLHNGSVASLHDMLIPANERPRYVQLGGIEMDVEKVGIKQDEKLAEKLAREGLGDEYYHDGVFILDTTLPGNSNQGHEFSDRYDTTRTWQYQEKGVIGPALSDVERRALIAFLKTL